jgi:hypothetical protein
VCGTEDFCKRSIADLAPLPCPFDQSQTPLTAGEFSFSLHYHSMNAYYIVVTDLLNVQPPHSFPPTLSDLDRLIQSMQVEG